jgi:uncharacterized membrane protein
MIGTGMWTVIAITLAVIDSICFAAAAVYQQRAVRRTVRYPLGNGDGSTGELHPRHHRLTLRGLVSLPSQPGWLGGIGLATVGVALHIVALILAPVTVVQPIGVLGVPIAVLLAARLGRQRPSRATVIPILLCVAGIGAFVWMAASRPDTHTSVSFSKLLIVEAALFAVVGVAMWFAHRVHGWPRCLANAVAGALSIGMVAALMRALVEHVGTDFGRFLDPQTLGLLGLMALNGAVGGWLVQQAYASGPAEVVLASLTVVDPMIAVVVGLALLGEGATLTRAGGFGMIIFGLLAVAGVVTLARTHPEVAARKRAASDLAENPTAGISAERPPELLQHSFDDLDDRDRGPLARAGGRAW